MTCGLIVYAGFDWLIMYHIIRRLNFVFIERKTRLFLKCSKDVDHNNITVLFLQPSEQRRHNKIYMTWTNSDF